MCNSSTTYTPDPDTSVSDRIKYEYLEHVLQPNRVYSVPVEREEINPDGDSERKVEDAHFLILETFTSWWPTGWGRRQANFDVVVRTNEIPIHVQDLDPGFVGPEW